LRVSGIGGVLAYQLARQIGHQCLRFNISFPDTLNASSSTYFGWNGSFLSVELSLNRVKKNMIPLDDSEVMSEF